MSTSDKTDSKTSGQGQQFGILPYPAVRLSPLITISQSQLLVHLEIQRSSGFRNLQIRSRAQGGVRSLQHSWACYPKPRGSDQRWSS